MEWRKSVRWKEQQTWSVRLDTAPIPELSELLRGKEAEELGEKLSLGRRDHGEKAFSLILVIHFSKKI